MRFSRRELLALCAASGAGWAAAPVGAQAVYPDHPVHLDVGFAAGSGADILARYYGRKLEELARQPMVIENKPGATGNIAPRYIAHAAPDGYNLLLGPSANMAGSRYLFKEPAFDTLTDFELIASFAQIAFVVAVGPNSPVKTLPELIARLKAKSDNMAGSATQTAQLSIELFKQITGARARIVGYKTGPDMMKDITDNTLDFIVLDGTFAAGLARQGMIRVLGVTTAKPAPSFPGVPPMAEAGVPGFEFSPWWGLYAPARTPQPVLDRLEAMMHEINHMPETAPFLENIGSIVLDDGPKEAMARLRADMAKWEMLVKAAGIEPQ